MTQREIEDVIFCLCARYLDRAGFRLNRRERTFTRKIPDGKQHILVPVYNYNPEFWFAFVVCIRLEAVEAIFNPFSGKLEEAWASGYTTITRQEYFTKGAWQEKFVVYTPQDVAGLEPKLKWLLVDEMVPFLDAHQDVPSMDRAVNRQQPSIDMTVEPTSTQRALILAHLAGNPDFERLVDQTREKWSKSKDTLEPQYHGAWQDMMDKFEKLVAYLRSRPVDEAPSPSARKDRRS
jgi:uncharacterized protein YqcC (DUF446 family)